MQNQEKRRGGNRGAGMGRKLLEPTQSTTTARPSIDSLLARLEGVRPRGTDRWVARCPAHEDKNPSLSMRLSESGALLLHCFGGCAPADVCAAIGLELGDLFPERFEARPSRDRFHYHAMREAFRTLHRESLVVAIGAEMTARGEALEPDDVARLWRAVTSIRSAVEACMRMSS